MLRIWDTFLYEGSKVLFRFAIAIFKYNEDNLLDIENSIGIFNHLRAMCQDATDVNRLTDVRQWGGVTVLCMYILGQLYCICIYCMCTEVVVRL